MWKDYSCLQRLDGHIPSDKPQLLNATLLSKISDKEDGEYTQDKEKKFLEESYQF